MRSGRRSSVAYPRSNASFPYVSPLPLYLSPSHPILSPLCETGPVVEARIAQFRSANGPVLFGGKLKSEVDPSLAMPDNLGLDLPEVGAPPPTTTL
jgi:hypothetical protein